MRNLLLYSSLASNLLLATLLIIESESKAVLIPEEQPIASVQQVEFSYDTEQDSDLNNINTQVTTKKIVVGNEIENQNDNPTPPRQLALNPPNENTNNLLVLHEETKRYKIANPDMPLADSEAELILSLSQFSSEELKLDALDLVANSLNDGHLILLDEYIYSNDLEVQEEAFIRLTEIGISEHSVDLFEYYQNHPSDWIQQDSTFILQNFYQR